MSSDVAICVAGLGKQYFLYERPQDRLKQALLPRWVRAMNRLRRATGLAVRPEPTFCRSFWALHDVSFEVGVGETVGIVGRNGSGKSTLLQLIAGTLQPTTGEIVVRGRIAALLELGSGFNPEFTGRENVFLYATFLGLDPAEIAARFDEIAAFADIGDFIEQPVKTYSSGMVVRLAFAVSVCVEPEILIVDEALAVGDAAFQFKCLQRIQKLAARGTTLLFVSHDMSLLKAFCHKAIYLEHGRIKECGDPETVATHYLFDIRQEQRLGAGHAAAEKRLSADGHAGLATAEACIRSATFLRDGATSIQVLPGQEVALEIELEFATASDDHFLALVVQTTKLLAIAGQRFAVPGHGGRYRLAWRNDFAAGDYFVSLRLERRVGWENYVLLAKQVAQLSFQSIVLDRGFLGLAALPFSCRRLDGASRRLDFMIAGAQKAGTTALHALLSRHPALWLPPEKELHFFDNDAHFSAGAPDYEDYHRHFVAAPPGALIGEATPATLWWRPALARLAAYNPAAKIIVVLRNPIERAWSHWNMERSRGLETLDFGQAIRHESERCRAVLPAQHPVWSYLERGFYAEQLRRLWLCFPREQTLVLRHEDLRDDPDTALGAVTAFLGVAPFSEPIERETIHATAYADRLARADWQWLRDQYEFEIRALERLLGWDCASWLEPPADLA